MEEENERKDGVSVQNANVNWDTVVRGKRKSRDWRGILKGDGS